MKLLTHIPAWLRNKYFISFAAFCVIMLFLDKNDVFTQMGRRGELQQNLKSKAYYTKELASLREQSEALRTSPTALEKLAREKLLLKRDNEELFLIPENPDKGKN